MIGDRSSGIRDRTVTIVEAGPDHLDALVPLFDAYRVFYEQPSDLERARTFLTARIRQGESTLFLARLDGDPAGFVQLYPSFSSVSTARIWILNDLYVAAFARRSGVARSLLEHAATWAAEDGAIELALETLIDNEPAKALYESLGWKMATEYDRYQLDLAQVDSR